MMIIVNWFSGETVGLYLFKVNACQKSALPRWWCWWESVWMTDRTAEEAGADQPRSTPPAPPVRRQRFLQRPTNSVDTTPHDANHWPPSLDPRPADQPRPLGPRWPSSPALAGRQHTVGGGIDGPDTYPLFLKRVVVAGDEYDDVMDDVSAYGLKRSN